MSRAVVTATIAVVLMMLSAPGTGCAAELSELTPLQAQGKVLFNKTCIWCHGPGVWGTNRLAKRFDKEHALLENRTDLTAAGIHAVVRTGLGSMPPYRKTEVSDADIEAIAAYLTRPH